MTGKTASLSSFIAIVSAGLALAGSPSDSGAVSSDTTSAQFMQPGLTLVPDTTVSIDTLRPVDTAVAARPEPTPDAVRAPDLSADAPVSADTRNQFSSGSSDIITPDSANRTGYYGDYAPDYSGRSRGAAASVPENRAATRIRLVDTTAAAAAPAPADTVSRAGPANADRTTPKPLFTLKTNGKVKLIVATGTTIAIAGLVTVFILAKKADGEKQTSFPDPPSPPGF